MYFWKDVLIQQERYEEFRREAEKQRLIQRALGQKNDSPSIPSQVFHRFHGFFARRWHTLSEPASADASTCTRPGKFDHPQQARE